MSNKTTPLFGQAKEDRSAWSVAHSQAKHLGSIKNKEARRQQIVMLCDSWKLALKGGKS